jgi:hypothetical protein
VYLTLRNMPYQMKVKTVQKEKRRKEEKENTNKRK